MNAPVDDQVDIILNHGYLANCNEAYAETYGASVKDMIGTKLSSRVLADDTNNAAFAKFILDGYLSTVPVFTKDVHGNLILERNTLRGHIEGKYCTGCTGKFEIIRCSGDIKNFRLLK